MKYNPTTCKVTPDPFDNDIRIPVPPHTVIEDDIPVIKPSELLLGYLEFQKIISYKKLGSSEREWLGDWNMWNLACSPMDDDLRGKIRYGHYLGWFARKGSE